VIGIAVYVKKYAVDSREQEKSLLSLREVQKSSTKKQTFWK